jgi:two-component system, OmpR family, response regulator
MPCRILVIDDYVPAATAIGRLLRLSGHTVMTTFSARNALSTALEFRPDVIFLDIGLPGPDNGISVAKQLREQRCFDRTLIVALTGSEGDPEESQIRDAGFDYHLVKPVGHDVMESTIAKAPRNREGRRANSIVVWPG